MPIRLSILGFLKCLPHIKATCGTDEVFLVLILPLLHKLLNTEVNFTRHSPVTQQLSLGHISSNNYMTTISSKSH